jgi:hypothetical protein
MANSLTVQTLEEGVRNIRAHVVALLDTSNLAVQDLFDPANYNCAGSQATPTTFRVDKIRYSITDGLVVELYWDATADVAFAGLSGRGKVDYRCDGGLHNNAGAGVTGKIQIGTTGWTAGTYAIDMEVDLIKIPGY